MKMWPFIILFIFLGVLIFLSLNRPFNQIKTTQKQIQQVEIRGVLIDVDLAISPAEKQRGLSGRSSLAENQGMLFIFDYTTRHPFWMKDMLIPIDMIWLDEAGVVVHIVEDAKPESYPALFGSNIESKYVLEVNAGFAKKHQIQIGDQVKFLSK